MKKKNNVLKTVLIVVVSLLCTLFGFKLIGSFIDSDVKEGYAEVDLTWRRGELIAVSDEESGVAKLDFKDSDNAIYSSEFEFSEVFEIVQDFESPYTYKVFVSTADSGWVEVGPLTGDYTSEEAYYISTTPQKVRIVVYAEEDLGIFEHLTMKRDFKVYIDEDKLNDAKEALEDVE